MDATRVVLADHHPIVRIGMRHLLEQAPNIQVMGETGDGVEALRLTLALYVWRADCF